MTGGREEKQWTCGKSRIINLQKVSSMVRDIGDPCLSHSHIKVVIAINRMLTPDKWQAIFDNEGKVSGFHKALKLIIFGGVDPSIRPEVWELLLGCYALSSTAEYRRRLRAARRERYKDLIRQCQMMHSSVGTGSLAYVVGSKVMDMRTSSKDEKRTEVKSEKGRASDSSCEEKCNNTCSRYNKCTDTENSYKDDISSDSAYPVSVRGSMDCPAHNYSTFTSISCPTNCRSSILEVEADGLDAIENCLDFPPLPIIDMFEQRNEDEKACMEYGNKHSTEYNCSFEDEGMHSFQINNNADLVIEPNYRATRKSWCRMNSEITAASPDKRKGKLNPDILVSRQHLTTKITPSDTTESPRLVSSSMQGRAYDERVSEWLWTLHRIVVDVVRTDSHLEFYVDSRNLARMSDILAVYAWVDPATGYCQGMSDLLSPFVVLFEDNADAFWCFEMLLRRMRQNFQMEGPTGVMKQLQALWHILEFTDREMFTHLSHIGAESLHFAFRMLLVLFRRELSFSEVLSMWEMMWAADFCESLAYDLEENCLEALAVYLPDNSRSDRKCEYEDNDENNTKSAGNGLPLDHQNENGSTKCGLQLNGQSADQTSSECLKWKSRSSYPFCGLTKNFWSRNDSVQMSTMASFTRNGGDGLPVFCVAAILIINRQKIIRETHSFDDMIKIFNDNILKINVRRCVHMAIRIRKKYFYKQIKRKRKVSQNGE